MTETDRRTGLARLQKPEYTGENRCIPCTIANVVIAGSLAVLLGLYSIPLGAGSFAVFLLAIYLRGYLVPYTPELTKRYVPDRVLRYFDKQPGHDWDTGAEGLVDIETALSRMELVEPCESADDLCLQSEFAREWQESIQRHNGDGDHLAAVSAMLDVEPTQLSMDQYGSAVVVRYDGQQVGQWESDAALVADATADSVLSDSRPEWAALDPVNRGRVLNSLRMFLEECPACGGPARLDQETVESCCRSMEVAAVSCDDCGARLFEVNLDETELA